MRRKIRKVELTVEAPSALKPARKVAGLEPRRWCPSFDHRGPWEPTGGLSIPDNATPEARELLAASAVSERCCWCGTERLLDSLSLRRKLRSKDFEAASLVRRGEEDAARRAANESYRGRLQTYPRKLFLICTTSEIAPYETSASAHLVGRYTTVCGQALGAQVRWSEWAGRGGKSLGAGRCQACHKVAMEISSEQLDVLFAYMLAVGRTFACRHPQDKVKAFDLETGRVLLSDEHSKCEKCQGAGMREPTMHEIAELQNGDFPAPAMIPCDSCEKRGWNQHPPK